MSQPYAIKTLQNRLKQALSLLKFRYQYDVQLIKAIKEIDAELPLSTAQFSKIKKGNKDISTNTYVRLLSSIDIIIKNELSLVWDEKNSSYSKEENNGFESPSNSSNPNIRLRGIFGVWVGLSYNLLRSEKDGRSFYSYFKIKITDYNRIVCQTHRATFQMGSMRIIGGDRLIIDISSDTRSITMIGNVGKGGDLSQFPVINFGYVDSGDLHTKSGFIVLIRTNEKYEEIKHGNYVDDDPLLADYKDHLNLLDRLKQLVIPPADPT